MPTPPLVTFSIIIPTCGRSSLAASLSSLLSAGVTSADEVLVVGDGPQPVAEEIVALFSGRLPVSYREEICTRMVGAHQRNRAMERATKTHLAFLDDDDTSLPGAFRAMREEAAANPGRILLFKAIGDPPRHVFEIVWKEKVVSFGNVTTQMIVVPNIKDRLGVWPDSRGSDYWFLRTTLDLWPGGDESVVWVDRVVAHLHSVEET